MAINKGTEGSIIIRRPVPGTPAENMRLWDEEVFIDGQDIYGLLSDQVKVQIYEEICRRVVSSEICQRCKEIERLLPNSADPARLRLKRSELDSQLEALENGARI